jgi:WD40 repeat protein
LLDGYLACGDVLAMLEWNQDTVQALEFDPTGQHLLSGSKDKRIFLWNVYGDCENYMVLDGHKSAILDAHWSYDATYGPPVRLCGEPGIYSFFCWAAQARVFLLS